MERGSEFHSQTYNRRIMRIMGEEYRESEQRRPIARDMGGSREEDNGEDQEKEGKTECTCMNKWQDYMGAM